MQCSVFKSWCCNLPWQLFPWAWGLSHMGVWFSTWARNALHASRCIGESKMALVPLIHASLTRLSITPAAYQVGHLAAVLAGRSQRTCPSPATADQGPFEVPEETSAHCICPANGSKGSDLWCGLDIMSNRYADCESTDSRKVSFRYFNRSKL